MSCLTERIDVGTGRVPADLVLKGVTVLAGLTGERFVTDLAIANGEIVGWGNYCAHQEFDARGLTAVPGFIDAHVHVESSLLTPYQFDRAALTRGTTTAICDPHELANVAGTAGWDYFLACARGMRMDLLMSLSSCVPASPLESSGAALDAAAVAAYAGRKGVLGLGEVMNFPGVLGKDPDLLEKIRMFAGRPIDGHAPLLDGEALNTYLAAGIATDHECSTIIEAYEKLRRGMNILIREGTAARNLEALLPLLNATLAPSLAFCTDDQDTLELLDQGQIDYMVRRAIALGCPPEVAYRVASTSAALIFGLRDRGLIAPGRLADLVLVSSFRQVRIERVMKRGMWVDEAAFAGRVPEPSTDFARHSILLEPVSPEVFAPRMGAGETSVIGLTSCSLLTDHLHLRLPAPDTVMAAVFARHGKNNNIGQGWVKGFGWLGGALASSVGHDSHNVCVVGDNGADMALAVNTLIAGEGGFAVVREGRVLAQLALPVAGLMSLLSAEEVAAELRKLYEASRQVCSLPSPFQQLSFLPLSVIPHLKLSDKGLVDVDRFEIIG